MGWLFLFYYASMWVAASLWTAYFFGKRKLPANPYIEFQAMHAADYSPIARLARIAVRLADSQSHKTSDAAIDAAIATLKQQAGDDTEAAAWQPVREQALRMAAAERPPSVAVLIAARNEERNLPACLFGLAAQSYWPLQITICDDQSTDGTAALLAEKARHVPGLNVITGAPLPEGWSGKNWALHQAVQSIGVLNESAPADQPKPEWLLFADADVELNPDAVFAAITTADRLKLDALSLFPFVQCETAAERLMVPFLLHMLALLFPADPKLSRPQGQYMACGMFLLIRRCAYEEIGGHAGIAGERVEDIALATKLHKAEFPIRWFLCRELAKTRMYTGWNSVWNGLSKNAYDGMGARPERLIVGLFVAFILAVMPAVSMITFGAFNAYGTVTFDAFYAASLNATLSFTTVIAVLFSAGSHARFMMACRVGIMWAFTLPISALVYMAICVNSAIQHWRRGGPVWKGRQYTKQSAKRG